MTLLMTCMEFLVWAYGFSCSTLLVDCARELYGVLFFSLWLLLFSVTLLDINAGDCLDVDCPFARITIMVIQSQPGLGLAHVTSGSMAAWDAEEICRWRESPQVEESDGYSP